MTSKEALERIWEACMLDITCQSDYETLKQALERLEELELNLDSEKYQLSSENESLKNRVEDLETCYKVLLKENQNLKIFVDSYANARDELLIKNQNLEKENQKLREEYDKLDNNFHSCYLDYEELEAENEKRKKAIEIIVNKMVVTDLLQSIFRGVDFYFFNANKEKMLKTYNSQYYIQEPYRLTEKEFELLYEMLREVLENE